MLDSIKNSLTGRVHYPHPYFIEAGAHSITFATYGGVSEDRGSLATSQDHRVRDLFNVVERMIHISDQLDEQLHAGYYFYILTSSSKFISNSVFVWPCWFLVLGLFVPFWLDYYTHESSKTVEDSSRRLGLTFMFSVYTMCAVFSQIPNILLGNDLGICLAKTPAQQVLR